MKSTMIRIAAAACLAVPFCLTPAARAQGPLTPPGAPAPMMRTLVQVEPRTPIALAGYTITQPGSYYLTTNLVSSWYGVVITASGVTLDLMGFALTGVGDGIGVFLSGETNAPVRGVVVRNGMVRQFADGIRAENCQNCRFEQLAVVSNSYSGMYLSGAYNGCFDNNTVADCIISENEDFNVFLIGYYGRSNGNAFSGCGVSGGSYGFYLHGGYAPGQCSDNTFTRCRVTQNTGTGFFLDSREGGRCKGNVIADCTISGCGGNGVMVYGLGGKADFNSVVRCSICDNGNYGVEIQASTGQCDGNAVADCMVSGNGNYGIYFNGPVGRCEGNTIARCTLRKNASNGIYLYYANGSRVEGNHVSSQTGSSTYGIRSSSSSGNLFLCNTCVSNTNNFSIAANDTYGPIVTNKGALPTTSGNAAVSPWANFSR